jgi:tRNA-2-methylthio-N6-dimethylallyladenosine synthase
MTDAFVPEDVIADRFERLRIVLDRSAQQRHAARVGKIESVLVEGPSKRDDSRWSGRTTQNKLVHFEHATGVAVGAYADVRVTHAGKHHLLGELVEVTAPPRHKTRIPVAAL